MADTLGRYVLERCIAVGGMGEVHLARQTGPDGFDRQCVVKTMHPHLSSDQEFVDLFLEEARLSAQLSHPNIAQVYDFGKVNDTYYLAMEYVDGPSVRDVIRACQKRQEWLNVEIGARVVSLAAQALDYVHRLKAPDGAPLNLVHRDISPANLLVSREGMVKVIDFGIAKARTTNRQTEMGVVRGKLAYVAPEQIMSLPIDGRADIFSLGLVLYELVALKRAIPGKSDVEIIDAARAWSVEPLSKARPDCPRPLVAVVERATERNRERRYQTAGELSDALEAALAELRLPVGPTHLRALAETFSSERQVHGGPLTPSSRPGRATPMTPARPSAPPAPGRSTGTAPGADRVATQLTPEFVPSGPATPADLEQTENHRVRTVVERPPGAESPPRVALPAPDEGRDDDKTLVAPPPHAETPSRAPLAFAAVGLVAVLGLGGWALFGRGQDTRQAPASPKAPPPVAVATATVDAGGEASPAAPPVAARQAPDAAVAVAAEVAPEPAPPEPAAEEPVEPVKPGVKPPRAVPLGALAVTSQPALEVVVDGRAQGTTPRTLKLRAGAHRVLLRSAKLGLLRDTTVRVEEGRTARLDWKPQEGTLEVRAVPPHVELEISVDGKVVGPTPMPALKLWEGTHTLAARNAASGWKAQQKVVVPPDGKLRVKVNDGAGIAVVEK